VSGEETDDILPALLDKLTAEKVGGTGRFSAFCSGKRAAKCLVFFSTGVLLKRDSRASKPLFLSGSS
jgi:hypothetical protein